MAMGRDDQKWLDLKNEWGKGANKGAREGLERGQKPSQERRVIETRRERIYIN